MDFTPTAEQAAAQGLAAQIFGDLSTPDRLAGLGGGTDGKLWRALADAGLLEAVEETGLLGLVLMVEEQGRTTAQVPFAASGVYGVLAVAAHGSVEQRGRLLPGLRDGSTVVTGAFPAGSGVTARATTVHGRARLTGVVPWVPWLQGATHVLVAVRGGPAAGAPSLWLVRMAGARLLDELGAPGTLLDAGGSGRSGSGVSGARGADVGAGADTTATAPATAAAGTPGPHGEPVELTAPWSAGRLVLDRAEAERIGGPEAYEDVRAMARTAFAGLQAGVCAGSLARAVWHTNQREQFGRPLAAKQGVQLRAAEAHMDVEAIRVTAYEAAWRRDAGLAYRSHALTAAWWASDGGRRVVHMGQHLHGGAGADLGHPVHRHFLWGCQLDGYLGSGPEVLEELGDLIVREAV
ncbi:acyl-CoA dehydrogenase family protein [Streptomyces sp. NPDC049813]|uniref:acyl-CoA dehydrogenase family protein n=1 Tax=Streptomyces sp. NPDC049813 TaxID=3365597 RepID=UPI0037BD6948